MTNKNKQQVEEEYLNNILKGELEVMSKIDEAYWQQGYPKMKSQLIKKVDRLIHQAKEEERERIMEKLVGEAQYYKCSKKCSGISPFCVTVDDIKALLTPKKDA